MNFVKKIARSGAIALIALLLGCASPEPAQPDSTVATDAQSAFPKKPQPPAYGESELEFLNKLRLYLEGDLEDFAKFEQLFDVKVAESESPLSWPKSTTRDFLVARAPLPFRQLSTPVGWTLYANEEIQIRIGMYTDGLVWVNDKPDPKTLFCLERQWLAKALTMPGWSSLGSGPVTDRWGRTMYFSADGYLYKNEVAGREVNITIPFTSNRCAFRLHIQSTKQPRE